MPSKSRVASFNSVIVSIKSYPLSLKVSQYRSSLKDLSHSSAEAGTTVVALIEEDFSVCNAISNLAECEMTHTFRRNSRGVCDSRVVVAAAAFPIVIINPCDVVQVEGSLILRHVTVCVHQLPFLPGANSIRLDPPSVFADPSCASSQGKEYR
jgi:hypothetical protein